MSKKINLRKYENRILLLFIMSTILFASYFYLKTGNVIKYHSWAHGSKYTFKTVTRTLNLYFFAQLVIVVFTIGLSLYARAKNGFCTTYTVAIGMLLSFSTRLQVFYSKFEKQICYMFVAMGIFLCIILLGDKILNAIYLVTTRMRKIKGMTNIVNRIRYIKLEIKKKIPAKVLEVFEGSIENKAQYEWNIQTMYYYLIKGILLLLLLIQVALLVKGKSINGASIWVSIAGISLQPGEFIKAFLILYFAQTSLYNGVVKTVDWRALILPLIAVLLLIFSKDLGNAMIIFSLIMISVIELWPRLNYWARAFTLFTLLIGGLVAIMFLSKIIDISYISKRFALTFRAFDYKDRQLYPSLISILKGGFFGAGLKNESYYSVTAIYQSESDLSYNTFTSIFGVISSSVLLMPIIILMSHGLLESKSSYHTMVIGLTAATLFLQVAIHVGGGFNIIPFTGICYPILSQGGSNLISNSIVLSVSYKALQNN